MSRRPPLPKQVSPGQDVPRLLRETYAEALLQAERAFRESQAVLAADDSDENRARYARALYNYDQLQGMFPFVAAGRGDAEA